ncbi:MULTISPECIES: YciI family protein, partial [unclassified Streptomyces]|uniref:YciI family protein n=1 Tax=unclassified Streptomyces TaxID=2593676 RepID=UPI001BE84DEE
GLNALSERLAGRPAHRALLQGLHEEGHLVAAGPWADDTGALLVFDVERGELDRLLEADPYYRTPGVEVLGVREWAPMVGRGQPATPAAPGPPHR